MSEADLPVQRSADGVLLALRLTPRAARDAVDGIVRDADGRPLLQLRIAAPPVEGAANAALIAFVAKWLGVRKGDVTIRSGETARIKRLKIVGDADALIERIARAIRS